MHILGVHLRDNHIARHALTSFYGVGRKVSHRICARLQIHDRCKVKELTPFQTTALAAFLSSPATSVRQPTLPTADLDYVPPPATIAAPRLHSEYISARNEQRAKSAARREKWAKFLKKPALLEGNGWKDPLQQLKIETELKREMRDNIAHQRMIGSYVGRRHALGLPVRGQNTQTNAKTARKLNRIERWA